MNDKLKIAIAADHGGFEQKELLANWLAELGYEVVDFGTFEGDTSVDYPDYAVEVARAVAFNEAGCGILVCGTGLGMAIAANKSKGIRAVPVTSVEFARLSREHNDANILCLSGRFVDEDTNKEIVETFLNTGFEGGRHQMRLDKITQIEQSTVVQSELS